MGDRAGALFAGTAMPNNQVEQTIGETSEPTRQQTSGQDGSHQQRLDRDAHAAPTQPVSTPGVEPHIIATQRNTSYHGNAADSGSSGHTVAGDVSEKRAIGQHASASSSADFVGEMEPRGVSVRRGKEEFHALERRMSQMSQTSGDLQRSNTRRSLASFGRQPSRVISNNDVEKQKAGEEEFDLAGTLKSGRDKQNEAGIKKKVVGVAWDDLEVVGGGGMKINIVSFMPNSADISEPSPTPLSSNSSCPCYPSSVSLATNPLLPSPELFFIKTPVSSSRARCVWFSVDPELDVRHSSSPLPTSETRSCRSREMSRMPV